MIRDFQLFIYRGDHVEIRMIQQPSQAQIDKETAIVKNKYKKLPKGVTKMLLKVNKKTVWKL